MKNNSAWGDYLSKLYGNAKIGEGKEVKINTNYKDFEDSFYGNTPIENAEEPQIPNEEYQKDIELFELLQQYLPETDDATVIEDEVNKPEDIVEPLEDKEFTDEEIKEFKRLNGYVDEVKEHIEQPTETKVKSVKVSKVNETVVEKKDKKEVVKEDKKKEVKKEDKKKEKPIKEAKPKSPRKPKK